MRAQQTFIKKINGQNRSYLYYTNINDQQETTNLPLVIVLHQNGSDANETYLLAQKQLSKYPCNMLFPAGLRGQWSCADDAVENDIEFLNTIIADTYQDFQHDRNRVYIVSDTGGYCLVENLKIKYPDLIAESRSVVSMSQELSQNLKEMLAAKTKTSKKYNLWVADDLAEPTPDSVMQYSFYKRWVIDFSAGGLYMFGSVKTNIKDGTNMDLSDAHSIKAFTLTKWFSNSTAWFVGVGNLSVPRKNESAGETTKVGGGLIVPISLGLKHELLSGSVIHPYVMAGGGLIWIFAAGAKVKGGNMPNLNSDYRHPLQMTLGSGIDFRIMKRLVLGTNLRYIQSAKFASLGKIDAISGLNFNFSLGYVFNANSSKRPPSHKH
ncbi:hypothetical protein [Mucilaginibacter sp. OK283]|uniref:hypothetical protein n=1 Tax=Mucilaginibacter sp. OK283 TaxID=1881049 RepID=UPI00115F7C8F|nr:hypothetical protein [Mucilaginibacter sp. OK283]